MDATKEAIEKLYKSVHNIPEKMEAIHDTSAVVQMILNDIIQDRMAKDGQEELDRHIISYNGFNNTVREMVSILKIKID